MQTMERTKLDQVDLRLAVCDEPPVGVLPVRLSCREHEDSTPSLLVYHDHVHCYSAGCGLHIGRRMEALAYLLSLPSWRDALRVAHKYTDEALDDYRVRAEDNARKNPLPMAVAELYHKQVWKPRMVKGKLLPPAQWYWERCLSDDAIERFLLGHDGSRFTIPVFGCDGELLNIRFRKDEWYCTEEDYSSDGKLVKKYSGVPGRNGTYLYPEGEIAKDTRNWIVICEGELDAVRLYQAGLPAATVTNGAGNICSILNKLKAYARLDTLLIATDMDEAGTWAGRQLEREALKQGYKVRRLTWPIEWGKDITELYSNGHKILRNGLVS